MSEIICSFYWDCGRSGNIEGLFITTQEELDKAFGKEIYFGEVLGKHSEIYGTLDKEDVKVLSDDSDFISKFKSILGCNNTVSGYNPLDNIPEEE